MQFPSPEAQGCSARAGTVPCSCRNPLSLPPLPGSCELQKYRNAPHFLLPPLQQLSLFYMQKVIVEPLPHRAPHVPTARAWFPTLIYFINKDPPLPWEEVFLGSRRMILIRTQSSNIIFLLLCSGLGLNQGTGAHLEEKKPWWAQPRRAHRNSWVAAAEREFHSS